LGHWDTAHPACDSAGQGPLGLSLGLSLGLLEEVPWRLGGRGGERAGNGRAVELGPGAGPAIPPPPPSPSSVVVW
jgi:hypothetical protein